MTEPRDVQPDHHAACDVARAAAALAVLVSHARSLILLDAGNQTLGLAGRLTYGLTGLGFQAVIVFFVLSGCLVARSMRTRVEAGGWSLAGFATARLARLWTVLIPCLILGGVLDRIGFAIHDAQAPGRPYTALSLHGGGALQLDVATFLGNVVFLQTRLVAPFGSNGALWSLAYEAWYYALAGLALTLWQVRRRPLPALVCFAGLALIIGWVMTPDMLALAPVWALGASLALLPRLVQNRASILVRWAALLLALATVAAVRAAAAEHRVWGEAAVACATAGCLLAWRHWRPGYSGLRAAGERLTGLTYSLYLSHLPFLALLTTLAEPGVRRPFGFAGLAVVVLSAAAALLYASLVWWCFERRTDAVRRTVGSIGANLLRLASVDAALRSGAG